MGHDLGDQRPHSSSHHISRAHTWLEFAAGPRSDTNAFTATCQHTYHARRRVRQSRTRRAPCGPTGPHTALSFLAATAPFSACTTGFCFCCSRACREPGARKHREPTAFARDLTCRHWAV